MFISSSNNIATALTIVFCQWSSHINENKLYIKDLQYEDTIEYKKVKEESRILKKKFEMNLKNINHKDIWDNFFNKNYPKSKDETRIVNEIKISDTIIVYVVKSSLTYTNAFCEKIDVFYLFIPEKKVTTIYKSGYIFAILSFDLG